MGLKVPDGARVGAVDDVAVGGVGVAVGGVGVAIGAVEVEAGVAVGVASATTDDEGEAWAPPPAKTNSAPAATVTASRTNPRPTISGTEPRRARAGA